MGCRLLILCAITLYALATETAAQLTTRGREFSIVFLPNYHNGGDTAPDSLYIFIVAEEPTTGTITFTNNLGQTQSVPFTISNPQQIYVHRVQYRPYELFGYNNNGVFTTPNENERISPRVFRVTADRDVAVYALNQALTTSDATLVLPTTTLGTEYYVMSYNSDGVLNSNGTLNSQYTPSQFAIVAIEDGTDVTIYPTAPTTETGMQVKTVRLNRAQAMLFQAEFSRQTLNHDLTGTRIVANKKIAVFAGHQRALVPVQSRGILSSRDQLYEQLIPRSMWGTTYILTPLAEPQGLGTPSGGATDLYRVLAAENGTEVRVNGRVVAVLQRGQFYQAPLQQAALLESSQPVMVALFKRSFSASSNLTLGDPFMMIIPPRRQYLSRYRFQSCQVAHPSGGITYYEHYITIVTTPNNVDSIWLDGTRLRAEFRQVPNTCYVYANVRTTEGPHTIESPRLFGLYVYGYGYADSYGYVGGMAFIPDVPDMDVTAGPDRELCQGDSVTISVQGNASAVRWMVAAGYPQVVIPCDTCRQIRIAPRATTKLLLTGYDSLGCSISDEVLITVYGPPQLRIRPDSVLCGDIPITLIAEGSFQSIQWTPTEGLGCSVCAQTTVTPQAGREIVYTAIARNGNSPHCEARDSIRVRYAPGLTGKVPAVITLCQGDSIVFTLDYGGTVRWVPSQGISCTDCKTVTFRPQRTTRYTVYGDSAGCVTQAVVEVRVVPRPTLAPVADTSICAGESVQLQLVSTGAEHISISPPEDVSCTNCPTPTFTPTVTRTYTITVSAGRGTGECIVRDTFTISVLPRPRIEAPGSVVLCAGDTMQVVVRVEGADNIRWEPTDGILCPTCDSTAIVATTSRTYTVIGSTAAGCFAQVTVNVTVHPRPILMLMPTDTAVCQGEIVRFRAITDGSLRWDPQLPIHCYDCEEIELVAQATRSITVESINAEGCSTRKTALLTVYPIPVVDLPDSVRICVGRSVQLKPIGVQPGYRYQWQPREGLSCSDCAEPVATPYITTRYTLTTVTADGCLDVDTVLVDVVPCRKKLLASLVSAVTSGVQCDYATVRCTIENPAEESDQAYIVRAVEVVFDDGIGTVVQARLFRDGDPQSSDLRNQLPLPLLEGERWVFECKMRLFSSTVRVLVRIRSDAGDTTLVMNVVSTPQLLQVRLVPQGDKDQAMFPGQPITLSLVLDADRWDLLDLREFELRMRYPSDRMYYDNLCTIAQRPDLAEGKWQCTTEESHLSDGQTLLTCILRGSSPLLQNGEVMQVKFGTLLGMSYRVEPTVELVLPDSIARCVQVTTTAAPINLHTCAGSLRFVIVQGTGFGLRSLVPNPSSGTVVISYEVGFEAPVRIELSDVIGRARRVLVEGTLPAGSYQLHTDVGDLPAGIYWCRYHAANIIEVLPLQIVR
ncbi:MAG: IgGFc-binding protein [Chlorobi bacterium]|nr:IgGFc-binding protein [Chlorobiota bacterium]